MSYTQSFYMNKTPRQNRQKSVDTDTTNQDRFKSKGVLSILSWCRASSKALACLAWATACRQSGANLTVVHGEGCLSNLSTYQREVSCLAVVYGVGGIKSLKPNHPRPPVTLFAHNRVTDGGRGVRA